MEFNLILKCISSSVYTLFKLEAFTFETQNYCHILEQIFCWFVFKIFITPLFK